MQSKASLGNNPFALSLPLFLSSAMQTVQGAATLCRHEDENHMLRTVERGNEGTWESDDTGELLACLDRYLRTSC